MGRLLAVPIALAGVVLIGLVAAISVQALEIANVVLGAMHLLSPGIKNTRLRRNCLTETVDLHDATSEARFASFARVAREQRVAFMIDAHDLCSRSMAMIALLRLVSSGRPRRKVRA